MTQNISDKKLILVIDDDEAITNMLKLILESEGYSVMVALGVEEAIAYINHRRPDLVLCDIMMPEKDGHDFLKALREDQNLSDLKVIMLTALGDFENIRKSVSGGAIEYITKPIEVPKLMAAVKSAFDEYYNW